MLEYVKTEQSVYFSVIGHHPASGFLSALDVTPKYWVDKRIDNSNTKLFGLYDMAVDSSVPGKYNGFFYTSGTMFNNGDYCEVYVSGRCYGTADVILAKSFRINDVYNANVVQTSGSAISPFFGKDIYYAQVRFTKDNLNGRDEYTILWYKNDAPVYSGGISNMGLSVYRGNDHATVFQNQSLHYVNNYWGTLRYNYSSSALASGEAYLVATSGVIDGQMRTWQSLVGIDAL